MRFLPLLTVLAALAPAPSRAAAPAVRIPAAESMYADIARQIAGPDAHVAAAIANPATDPHLFEASPSVAREVARDPAARDGLRRRETLVQASLAALRARLHGIPVAETEPVFGYMAAALDLRMREEGFQRAVMNDTEPAPRQVAAFSRICGPTPCGC